MPIHNQSIQPFTLEVGGALEYELLSFCCTHCQVRLTRGITTELIYGQHGDHLELVTLEIKISGREGIFELQPLARFLC